MIEKRSLFQMGTDKKFMQTFMASRNKKCHLPCAKEKYFMCENQGEYMHIEA